MREIHAWGKVRIMKIVRDLAAHSPRALRAFVTDLNFSLVYLHSE